MVKEGIYHNTVNYTSWLMTYLCLSMWLHLCHLLCVYTPVSPGVSAHVFPSVTKPESPCVPIPISSSGSSDGVDWKPIGLQNLGNTYYLNSVLQCIFTIDCSTSFFPANTESLLIHFWKEFTENKKESKDVRVIDTLLISNERNSILSNAEQSTVHGEVQGIFHTNNQQDAH